MTIDTLPDGLLRRHQAFWHLEPADEPLLSVGRYRPQEHRARVVGED